MATYADLIANALIEIGAIATGETPSASDLALGLSKLNRMIGLWNAQSLLVPYVDSAEFAFGTSKQSYTIGPAASSADFTSARPIRIVAASIVLVSSSPYTYIPLDVMNVEEYGDIRVPATSSTIPTRLYYKPTVTKGTLYPWPYPTVVTNKLSIDYWAQLAEVATADTIALAPGYEEALTTSLAEALGPSFGRTIAPELEKQAQMARSVIKGLNSQAPKLGSDFPGSGSRGAFNYLTGGFR